MLIIGEYIAQPGLSPEKAIAIVEKALIEHALTEGYTLLNNAGTKTPTHAVRFSGFIGAKQFSGGKMYVKKSDEQRLPADVRTIARLPCRCVPLSA
jgi:hypothetical protein